jgi:hypothetical protein
VGWGETVHFVRRPLFGLTNQFWICQDECGAAGGMKIGRGNRSTRRKPAPVPHCSPQIPHDLGSNPGPSRWKAGDQPPCYGRVECSSLCYFLQYPITPSPLLVQVFSSAHCSRTLEFWSFLNMKQKFHAHAQQAKLWFGIFEPLG